MASQPNAGDDLAQDESEETFQCHVREAHRRPSAQPESSLRGGGRRHRAGGFAWKLLGRNRICSPVMCAFNQDGDFADTWRVKNKDPYMLVQLEHLRYLVIQAIIPFTFKPTWLYMYL